MELIDSRYPNCKGVVNRIPDTNIGECESCGDRVILSGLKGDEDGCDAFDEDDDGGEKTGGRQFSDDMMKLLLCALIEYLGDWAPAKDYDLDDIPMLVSMAEAREKDIPKYCPNCIGPSKENDRT